MSKNEIQTLLHEIRAVLSSHRNETRATQMTAYMKGHFDFYGISSVQRREITKPIVKNARQLSIGEKYVLAQSLWREPEREAQYMAMDILGTSEKKVDMTHIELTLQLIQTKSWWDTVDWLASHLVGNIVKDKPVGSEEILLDCLGSENIWLNRTCLIHQLFYKKQTDFDKLKDYIMVLEPKKEFFIQKAIGWALRQYSKTDPIAVEGFVADHPELSNLARREAMKHINRHR